MAPLPEHEDDKEIISDLVKALLEELDIEFRCLGSTTFKNQFMAQGIEPDQCFYIKNEALIRGKKRQTYSGSLGTALISQKSEPTYIP